MERYEVIITNKAQLDFADHIEFVKRISIEAAVNLANEIYVALESLSTFPERFPLFEMPKTFPVIIRKQIINNRYVALYSIEDKKVVIYRILDSKKKLDYLIR